MPSPTPGPVKSSFNKTVLLRDCKRPTDRGVTILLEPIIPGGMGDRVGAGWSRGTGQGRGTGPGDRVSGGQGGGQGRQGKWGDGVGMGGGGQWVGQGRRLEITY